MTVINQSASNTLLMNQNCSPETSLVLDVYGTLEDANIYFDNRINGDEWTSAELKYRRNALTEATRIIDQFNYLGCKIVDHQFPRLGDNRVPKDIEFACYEIAFKLIQGYDADFEVNNLATTSRGLSTVRTTYDRTFALEHLSAGVPSAKAWSFLKPYLRDNKAFNIRRAN